MNKLFSPYANSTWFNLTNMLASEFVSEIEMYSCPDVKVYDEQGMLDLIKEHATMLFHVAIKSHDVRRQLKIAELRVKLEHHRIARQY